MKNEKTEKAIKSATVTVRLTEMEYSRLKRACFRDEIKLAEFAHEALMHKLERLVKKQDLHGYKCMEAL